MNNSINTTQEVVGKKKNNKSGIMRTLMKIALATTLTATTPQFTNATESTAPQTEQVEQDTIPNHITNTEKLIGKYYPNYAEYFKPIFSELKGLGTDAINIFNKKIQENFEIFEEELTTEKDKCTTILIAIDDLLGEKTFIKGEKQVDSEEGEELIIGIANEIASDIKVKFVQEFKKSKEELEKGKERLAKADERLTKADERLAKADERLTKADERLAKTKKIKENTSNNENPEIILKSIEELLEISELNEIKSNKGLQEIVKYYISIGKKINWKSNEIGKKFINEYNKL